MGLFAYRTKFISNDLRRWVLQKGISTEVGCQTSLYTKNPIMLPPSWSLQFSLALKPELLSYVGCACGS